MQLYLLLNNTCNLNCSFCIRGHQNKPVMLDVEKLKIILKTNNFNQYHLLLTGGEPSLHPCLPEIIDLCLGHFKSISINTNGLNSSWIDHCLTNQIHVQISLDGTPTVHNKIRGNGKINVYDSILTTIYKLNDRNISYNISTTVGNDNYEDIKYLCQEINSMPKIKYWKVSPKLPFGCANEDDVVDIEKWNELVDFLLDNASILLKIKKLFDFELLEKYLQKTSEKNTFPKTNCGNVKYKIYVYPDYTVYPCTCLTDFPIGNLFEERLSDILKSEASSVFKNYRVKPESTCHSCKYLKICNGGCIGMSYNFFGKLGMGDYRCPLMKKQ